MRVIVGLGNPGREYERHRHNIGFRVVDALCQRHRLSLNQSKFDAQVGLGEIGGERVLLVEPQTFMNVSGRSVAPALRFYKATPKELLVIHDELDLPFGKLQLKGGGGAGGHNGLRSIIEQLGEDAFARLRIGIGKPEGPGAKDRVSGHVLSGFSADEENALADPVTLACDMAETWLKEGLGAAMNRHNRK